MNVGLEGIVWVVLLASNMIAILGWYTEFTRREQFEKKIDRFYNGLES